MNRQDFIYFMESHPELHTDLFIRGFLITDQKVENLNDFPFYQNWKSQKLGKFYFLSHSLTGMHIFTNAKGNSFFILGHAYDPFTMEYSEDKILKYIAESYGTPNYFEHINDLTGLFVYGDLIDNQLRFLVDPSGMQSACCGKINGNFYLSSHPQLVGDLCDLRMDPFVDELIHYKWYNRVMGPYLPADLTPFTELKRVIPSTLYQYKSQITHKRFWPLHELKPAIEETDYQEVIQKAADILKNNMALAVLKWNRPWVSLTGGIDSNTTFAAGNGNYNSFETFSYISADKEIPDAAAAKCISNHFSVKHHEFRIPNANSSIENFDAIKEVLIHNNGYVATTKDNELRKRVILRRQAHCDVEIKSWTSETIRAYWYKHYGRKTMPKLSAKLFRNLYKIFITNRSLAHKIDRIFETYLQEFEYDKIPISYPPADINYNEVTWGSWGGLNISEMKYCFDITIIYNNRRFLDLLFRVPLEKRISDQHHLDMKKYLNKELYDMNIRVVNQKETQFRALALNIIFTLNSILPF